MIGPKNSYVDILYHVVKQEEQVDWSKKMPLRPSSAGECEKVLAYRTRHYLGLEEYPQIWETKEPKTQMLLDLGNYIERQCISWFRKASDYFTSKYKQQTVELFRLHAEINGEPRSFIIEGSCDDVYWSDKYKALVDYKSKGVKYSSHRTSTWEEDGDKLARIATQFSPNGYYVEDLQGFLQSLNDPYFEANFLQLNTYANTDFFKQRGVDHACVIQYNKNTSALREIRFKPCAEVFESVRVKFQNALDAAVKDPSEANRTFALGSVKCAFCPLASSCRPSEKVKQAHFGYKKWPTDAKDLPERVSELFADRQVLEQGVEELAALDQELLVLLESLGEKKVKLANGDVYEVKRLKSPRPHDEIRRGKL